MFHNTKLKRGACGMNVIFCVARIICIQRTYELQGEANEVSFSRRKLQLSTVIVKTCTADESRNPVCVERLEH
jgi:hypothetical protein